MAQKTIIAYFMHEGEEYAAGMRMTGVERTDSFLVGQIEESAISALQEQGVIVQVLEDEAPPSAPGARATP